MPEFAQVISDQWKAAGAAAWGAVAFRGLLPFLTAQAQNELETMCPQAAGVLVAAFPYFGGEEPGNLSLYCRGEDYHTVLHRRLAPVCAALQRGYPPYQFLPGVDNHPIPELAAARLAGLGQIGKHGLCIIPPYGSYLFLGTILTDFPLETTANPSPLCCQCNACVKACPTGALQEDGFDFQRCLSHVTQKKGELSPQEAAWVRKSPTIWGCDLCQKACPWNQKAVLSPLPEFREGLRASLTEDALEGLSNKAFRRMFGDRAFAWRGIAPLRRNLAIQKSE